MVDVILSRREDFRVFDTYISEYDRSMALLDESCRSSPAFAGVVKKFEVSTLTPSSPRLRPEKSGSYTSHVCIAFRCFNPLFMKPAQHFLKKAANRGLNLLFHCHVQSFFARGWCTPG